jgi:hypothetical protein
MRRNLKLGLSLMVSAMVVTAGVIAAGLASAAIPDAAGVIHACVHNKTGLVRVVESEASCRPDEAAISWKQEGPSAPGPGIVARIRAAGPVTFPGGDPIDVPLLDDTWSQGEDELQEIVGRITWDRCENSGMFVDVLLDGVQRLHLTANDPAPRFRGPASPIEFRLTQFEPSARVQHTLSIHVSEFACYQGDPGTVQSVTVDVIGWK